MQVFYTKRAIAQYLNKKVLEGETVGFVPTMGALHAGHISLIMKSRRQADVTVCSIFVNPTQFNDPKDFEMYPVTISADLEKLEKAGCHAVFIPTVGEMYPDGLKSKKPLNFGFLAETLEGEHRPGHFNGMAQIVEMLLRVVKPHLLFMGQKDYQQQLIVAELIKKRKLKTKLVTCPTMREKDGLAMSSRNVRLDKKARELSVEISKTLKLTIQLIKKVAPKLNSGESYKTAIEAIRHKAVSRLKSINGVEVEYLEIRNASSLQIPIKKSEKLVVLIAVQIDGVRLIDNLMV